MDVANELLDAIEIIVDKKIRENTAQIYFGVCKGVNGDSCVMSINGKNNTIHFYGSAPIVGLTYRVFVPNGNMSMAFAITGNDDRKGLYYSNPNLLDNWYFGNPVNQRGQTSWSGLSDYGPTIDRWGYSPSTVATLTSNGVTLTADWQQHIENTRLLVGQQYTMSALTGDGRLGQTTFTFVNGCDVNVGVGIGYLVIYNGLGDPRTLCRIYGDGNTYLAAKLELGSKQTLAHQDADGNWALNEIPDYGEQLARCQRYFQLYSTADNRPSKAVDCRPTMHTDPSQGTIIIDGTTYYYNTADL